MFLKTLVEKYRKYRIFFKKNRKYRAFEHHSMKKTLVFTVFRASENDEMT